MHIAAALARPLVVVYGSTSPGFTPPLSDNAVIVSAGISCSPCFKRQCPLQAQDEHMQCMESISVARVLEAMAALQLGDGLSL